MQTDLIDFEFDIEQKIIKSQPSYFELEQKIVEQQSKIICLEDTINDIKNSLLILETYHNSFWFELEYIDYNDLIPLLPKNMLDRRIVIDKSLVKKRSIDITCDELDLSNVILSDATFGRIFRLHNLQYIKIRIYTFSIVIKEENKITIVFSDYYYSQGEEYFKNMLSVDGIFRNKFTPEIKIII